MTAAALSGVLQLIGGLDGGGIPEDAGQFELGFYQWAAVTRWDQCSHQVL